MIELRSLGTATLVPTADGVPVVGFTEPKRLALLVYLVVAQPRGFHRRDALLSLLWSELDHEHARGALRRAVHMLRQALGEDVGIARGQEEIAVEEGRVSCDAVALEAAVTAGDFAEAVRLYQGDFLRGVRVKGAPAFERWAQHEGERLQDLAYRASRTLSEIALRDRQLTEACRWAHWAADLMPYDETALHDLMRTLYRASDRAEAVRACCATSASGRRPRPAACASASSSPGTSRRGPPRRAHAASTSPAVNPYGANISCRTASTRVMVPPASRPRRRTSRS
ncbi:MAG: AfsR/SARP family transcriptional regulator [Gemmatimonadales bacterium]